MSGRIQVREITMSVRRSVFVLAAAVCVLGADRLAAQRIVPSIGVYVPVSDLGAIPGVDGAIDLGKKESTRAYGLALEWGSGGTISFRGSGAYATDSGVPISGVGCTTCASRSTMLALTGGIVLRPIRLLFLEPYVIAGLGVKRYDFSTSDFENGFDMVLEDRNERTFLLGVGGELNLGVISGIVEVSDYFNDYDSGLGAGPQRRHDFIVSIGIGIGN